MATYTLLPNVKRQFLDNSGNPLASGKIYTVEAGGTYPADAITTYQTSSGTAHTNPIILDSAGRISGSSEIYAEPGQSYKLIAASSSSDYTSPLWTQDNIGAVPGSANSLDFAVTLAVNVDAGDLLYLSDGSGAVTAGTWAKADADNTYSSTLPEMGFAVTAGSAGGTIQVRSGGLIALNGPLSPGTKYFVSATAGAITSSAPANRRFVGTAQSATAFLIDLSPPLNASNIQTGTLPNAQLATTIAPTVVALTDGATVALDASLGTIFRLDAAGNRTILTPTNPVAGQKMVIAHEASGGARTLSLTTGSSGAFRFGTDITGLTATGSGLTDYIGCIYNGTDSRWDVVAYSKGY